MIPLSEKKPIKTVYTLSFVAVFFIFGLVYLDVNPLQVFFGLPQFIGFFFEKFLPPDFRNFSNHLPLVLDTILFALVATYFSSFMAFIIALSMSEMYNPIAPLRLIFRFFVSFFRNMPILILAQLLVFVFGIGSAVGLLALVLATLGFLSRAYADSLDEISHERIESLVASGATRAQVLIHGVIPSFFPTWISWTLFIFEINIRASILLGIVGAGGIGIMVRSTINQFRFKEAMSIIIIIVGLVLITETLTNWLRKKVA